MRDHPALFNRARVYRVRASSPRKLISNSFSLASSYILRERSLIVANEPAAIEAVDVVLFRF